MGPDRSSSLSIGGDSSTVAGSGRVRDASIRSAAAEPQNAPRAPPLPLGKDKGKINLIKYPGGSDYLKSVVHHALNVGPSKVGLPPLVISDLPSSHRSWKGRFFFVSGFNWEYNPSDRDDTLGVQTAWNALDSLREYLRCFRYDLSEGDCILLILYYLHVSQVLALTLGPKIMSSLWRWRNVLLVLTQS